MILSGNLPLNQHSTSSNPSPIAYLQGRNVYRGSFKESRELDSSNHPYDGNGTDEEHLLEDDTRVHDENEVNFVDVLNNMKTYVSRGI